jgi:hypothetical protein
LPNCVRQSQKQTNGQVELHISTGRLAKSDQIADAVKLELPISACRFFILSAASPQANWSICPWYPKDRHGAWDFLSTEPAEWNDYHLSSLLTGHKLFSPLKAGRKLDDRKVWCSDQPVS